MIRSSIEDTLSEGSYLQYVCRRQRPAIRTLLLAGTVALALTMLLGDTTSPAITPLWIRSVPLAVLVVLTWVVWRTENDITLQLATLGHVVVLLAGLLFDNASRPHGLLNAAPAVIIVAIASSMLWMRTTYFIIGGVINVTAMAMVLGHSQTPAWIRPGLMFYMALSIGTGAVLYLVNSRLHWHNFELELRLNRSATVDELTGLANRRRVLQLARRLFARCRVDQQPFSVLYIDADRFKEINDRHGHDRGDQVLRHLAGIIERTVRPADLVGRLGGEEFIAVLPGVGLAEAAAIAERIRSATVASPLQELPVTVSIGVATSHDYEDFRMVLNAADACVLQAKRKGRNRVQLPEE
ncbi:GGDEF domain-containing protein [Dyella subtropica]|uniref:GGDEF domain-containing protein n=1 Tax=Dyella subtropica TaxID=2992127 RepID=UPI002254F168|nr:diguanylate cyclase [Dyella subtropica]